MADLSAPQLPGWWRVVAMTWELAADGATWIPTVRHEMYGPTQERAIEVYQAHMQSDAFLRGCTMQGPLRRCPVPQRSHSRAHALVAGVDAFAEDLVRRDGRVFLAHNAHVFLSRRRDPVQTVASPLEREDRGRIGLGGWFFVHGPEPDTAPAGRLD